MTRRGQALAESIPFIPVLLLFIALMLTFTEGFLIRQKLLVGVRFAAFLYSAGRTTPQEAREKLLHYLTQPPLALARDRLDIHVGRLRGHRQARLFELDEVRVRYQPTDRLSRLLGNTFEEHCVIKHAPHYGAPYPSVYGPAVNW